MVGKRVLIIFPYSHLAYSPTILNLCKLLKGRGHDVKVIYGIEEYWGEQTPRLDGVELENISYSARTIRFIDRINKYAWDPITRILRRISLLGVYARLSLREILLSRMIKKALNSNSFNELITVDILPLYWAQQENCNSHFVSLEISEGLQLVEYLDTTLIKSVVIQSQERLERLFGNLEIKKFFIQNAPSFVEPVKRTKPSPNLIYNGAVWAPFGALDLIKFIEKYPEYTVHFKGSMSAHLRRLVESEHKALIGSGVLSFSDTYLDDNDLKAYLAEYSIGFCLYDFNDPFISKRLFNYETAPSGKVFMYLSVGMPVIATRIKGFRFFEEGNAGILIDDHKPETIKKAVGQILSNYGMYSDNALSIGRKFSFNESAKPFVDFVSQ